MGVVTKFRKWLAPHQQIRTSPPPRTVPPVAIDLHEDDPDADLDSFDLGAPEAGPGSLHSRPRRSRQELVAELQRNYQEVLGIVRKVDSHLDRQAERHDRLAEIAERFPRAADDLAQARVRQEQACEIMDALARSLNARDDRLLSGQTAQLERLDEVRDLMAESAHASRQLLGSLIDFRDIMSGLAGATERLNDAVARIEQRDQQRSADLLAALTSTKKWAIALTIVVATCGLVAIAVATIR
ncbi:MAG: hypothetical protein IPJ41_16515 [Phycisphaerales bacterium]|nr:hypothetical protein [Phycisphaerales bacterium]